MLTRSRWELLLLVCATALTRFAFRSHFLYDLDSLGFALRVEHFKLSCLPASSTWLFLV
jgi:hypothetical protein